MILAENVKGLIYKHKNSNLMKNKKNKQNDISAKSRDTARIKIRLKKMDKLYI